MPAKKPSYEQAQLQVQLYDLRREARLRAARKWFAQNFFVEKMEDVQKLAPPGSKHDASVRMLIGYWEMVCQLLECGLLHEELFFHTTNEQYLVWQRLKPVMPEFRKRFRNPHMLENLEKAAKRYEKWMQRRAPGHLELWREFSEQMRKSAAGKS
jgi:hypothetical protein